MDSLSVYELITKLCDSIVTSKDVIPTDRNAKCLNCRRRGVKQLRALSYEILLHKSTLPTYPHKLRYSDGFECIKDPAYDILLLSKFPLDGRKQSRELQDLQKSISFIIKSGFADDSNVQPVLQLLLNLKDEAPEGQSNSKDVGWFNTGLSRWPRKYSCNGTVPPYTIYGPEIFLPTLMEKSLTQMQSGRLQYALPRLDLLNEKPGFKVPSITGRSQSNTSLPCCKSNRSYSISNLKCIEVGSDLSCDDSGTDFWGAPDTGAGTDLRTWEALGDPNPRKHRLHLTEVATTTIYDLMRLEKAKNDPRSLTTLNFVIVPYAKYVGDLKNMLIGVHSTSFRYDQAAEKFVLQADICVDGLSPQTLAANASAWTECGSYCRRLTAMHLAATRGGMHSCGRIYGALMSSVGEYLYFYKAAIMGINERASILGIQVRIQKLRAQVLCLSHLCRLDSDEPLPMGVRLLAYIYDKIMANANPDQNSILIVVLKACVTAYLSFLQTWLYAGSIVDPHQEFFVERKEQFAGERTRLYWKNAFVVHKTEAAGFLKGLDKAIFETGKALNLLKLCNPQDPLVGVVDDSAPRLRFVLSLAELPELQGEHEAYYQRAVSVAGQPVTVTELLQRSHDRQAELHERVKQVWEERAAQYAAERAAQAAEKASKQREQQVDMELQARIRSEHKQREKQEERELREREEKWERERVEKEMAVAEEAKQTILEHYSELFKTIEERKQQVLAQLAREEGRYTLSDDDDDDDALEQELAAGSTGMPSPHTQVTPNNNEAPAFFENSPVDINSFLDNYSASQLTADNNRLNMNEDVQNRNLGTLDISPPCDNIIGPKDTDEVPTSIPSDFNQAAQRKTLSLDLTDKHGPRDCKAAENDDDWPCRKGGSKVMSQEQYSELAKLGSRKSSADRIREKMLGYKAKTQQDTDGFVVTADGRLMQKHDGNTPMLTAQQIKNKVLEQEYHIGQSPTRPDETAMLANRRRNLHGDFDVVTGANKADRKHGTYSKVTQQWTPSDETAEPRPAEASVKWQLGPTVERSELPSPSETLATGLRPHLDYFRGESLVSVNSLTVAPSTGSLSPAADTASMTSADSAANPFFKSRVQPSRSFNRLYSYAPFSQFDKDWQLRLRDAPGNIAKGLSPAAAAATGEASERYNKQDLRDVDVDSVNHALKKATIVAVRTQMRLVNDSVVRHFLVDQDLLSHLQSLRDYFFLLDGEFCSALTSSLFAKLNASASPSDLLHPAVLHSVLTEALACAAGDAARGRNAARLRFALVGEAPAHFQHSAPDVLSCVTLDYDVSWPLNILITREVINKYRQVFEFLLKLRRISWVLEDVFATLKPLGKERGYAQSPQYARVQKYRHVMSHLVQALHNYVTSTVLQESWADLQHDLQAAAVLDDIYLAHVIYIKRVLLRCLLLKPGTTAFNFQTHLSNIFKLVLRFHGQLGTGRWTLNARTRHYEHAHYGDFVQLFRLFHEQARSLVKLTKKLAVRGHYSHLFDMLQRLNMNDYYEQHGVAK